MVRKLMNSGTLYMIWDMVKRDFRNKYAGSVFGLLWNLILPIAYILIYTTVFSQIMAAKLPGMTNTFDYSVYLSSGILAWTIFNNTLTRFQNVFVDNANIVKKIYFPKTILVFSITVSSIIELIINYSLLLLVLVGIGYDLHLNYIVVFLIILLQQVFCTGIGLILSVFNVHFRDLNQITSIFIQVWFWLTPIVYVLDILPDGLKKTMSFNPLYYFIESYQSLVLRGDIVNIMAMLLISLVTFLFGWIVYKRMINEISDLI
ncbi:ABC transporter permease [Paenibacillus sp. p3-SID1389]|uniref:ABC transporter permease n=1 Tax=Paenibacillus sp. p3-SID1389 TaxID=2916364 RepID=UPI0021A89382|nr:ABC transporter permease [Paenibacillus sp. p3-SID1389]MCT2195576.1 ABC transporter permease [Paenibacillus sp. p3-SID1389]